MVPVLSGRYRSESAEFGIGVCGGEGNHTSAICTTIAGHRLKNTGEELRTLGLCKGIPDNALVTH
jgi:hypothetical protein